VGEHSFAVLLPDDVLREPHAAHERELTHMVQASTQFPDTHLLAVKPVPRSRMTHCGVARLGSKEIVPGIYPIAELVEKPDPTHPVCRAKRSLGIVGRYIMEPAVFTALHELKHKGHQPLELTDALEYLRKKGHHVFAFELKANRQDMGQALDQASALMGTST
jgi:UTP--glucose-1-phosphate uridylyltransferase